MARKHERRLKKLLHKRKLLFVHIGARHAEDRIISTFSESNGATTSNRKYNKLIRDIVACVLAP